MPVVAHATAHVQRPGSRRTAASHPQRRLQGGGSEQRRKWQGEVQVRVCMQRPNSLQCMLAAAAYTTTLLRALG